MIRILTFLVALLLIANIVTLLWPDKTRSAPHMYSPQADVNPHFVRLNKEIEDKYLAEAMTTDAATETPALVHSVDPQCYRLGPFMHRANYELAEAVLFNANIKYTKSNNTSKQSDVFRVYLGPFLSQPEALDMRVQLRRLKVLDHFIRKEGNGQYIVSLGIYTTRSTAVAAVAQLSSKIDTVKMKQESVVLPDSYWLHFEIDEENQIRTQLTRIDWGEPSAKMGKYQCPSA